MDSIKSKWMFSSGLKVLLWASRCKAYTGGQNWNHLQCSGGIHPATISGYLEQTWSHNWEVEHYSQHVLQVNVQGDMKIIEIITTLQQNWICNTCTRWKQLSTWHRSQHLQWLAYFEIECPGRHEHHLDIHNPATLLNVR